VELRERELDWQRQRLFPAWDRTGGPSRVVAWSYRHPALASTAAAVPVATVVAAFAISSDRGMRHPGSLLIAFLAIAVVDLFTKKQLYEEWHARRRAPGLAGGSEPAGPEFGYWDRVAATHQAGGERPPRRRPPRGLP
jgi:hypothetical protein